MDNLLFSLRVILPVFLLMALGYGLRRIRLIDGQFTKQANKLGFKVLLPTLLFYNVYQSDLHSLFDGGLVAFAIVCILAIVGLLLIVIPLIEKDPAKRGAMIQGIFRSNYVIFGVPVAVNMFGTDAAPLASMLAAVVVPLFNLLAVLVLELFSPAGQNRSGSVKRVLLGIAKNPLILGSLLGVVFVLCGIKLPGFLETAVGDVAKTATPIALLVLGADFQWRAVGAYRKQIAICTGAKLLILPAIVLPIAVALGFRGQALGLLLILLAAPTAVSSYAMADQMGADAMLAAQLVVFTTVLSSLSLFVFVFILKCFGLI